MDVILLKDILSCPRCRARKSFHPLYGGNCRNCGVRLFINRFDWHEYERVEGNREWYLFTKDKGWIHRSHLLDFDSKEVAELKPLHREVKLPKLDKDYGTKTAEQIVAEKGLRLRKKKPSSGKRLPA